LGKHKQEISGNRDIIAFVLALIGIHVVIVGFITGSVILACISFVDGITAMQLGLKTNSNTGHAGILIGIITMIAAAVLILAI